MRFRSPGRSARYTIWFALGLVVFIGGPETVRWFHGGALAQQVPFPGNTTYGTVIQGNSSYSVTGTPGQTGPVVGGESNVIACPGQSGNIVGTYVPPGGSLHVTVTDGGGSGSVTGFRSTVTVGGPGCQ